jgi:hypothetical protein
MVPLLLAQLDRDEALARGYWNLSMIALVGLIGVVFLVAVFLLRRWKRDQLKQIEENREARRARQTEGRVDAWRASAERYVDRDKLEDDDDLFKREGRDAIGEDRDEPDAPDIEDAHPDDRGPGEDDPFGLFDDKPYRDPDDEDDFDGDDDDEDEDWEDDEDGFRKP